MKKNAKKKKNERVTERKLGGCQVLLKVFAQRLKSEDEDLEGSRIIQSQYPSTIQAFGLLQRNNVVRLTAAGFTAAAAPVSDTHFSNRVTIICS